MFPKQFFGDFRGGSFRPLTSLIYAIQYTAASSESGKYPRVPSLLVVILVNQTGVKLGYNFSKLRQHGKNDVHQPSETR